MATIIQTESGSWKAIIRRPRFGVPLKVRTFTRKEDADGWGRKVESEIERSVWRDVGDAERMKFRTVVESYELDEVSKRDGAVIEKATFKVMKREPIMDIVIARIDRGNIKALRDGWIKAGYAVGTVNRRLTMLRSVFEYARVTLKMHALENPAAGMHLDGENKRERRVSDEEIDALLEVSHSVALPAFVKLAVETAMRRSELFKLEWSMLDLVGHVARLPGRYMKGGKSVRFTKNGKPRDVPLSPIAVQVLKDLKKQREAEVRSPTRAKHPGRAKRSPEQVMAMNAHSVTTALRRATNRCRKGYVERCKARDVEPDSRFLVDLRFHDLRHEATSRLAKIFDLHELMKITGQSSARMLMRYYHPDAGELAARMRLPKQKVQPAARNRKNRGGRVRATSKK